MSFILKIVAGPNKGAEIALPEGVAVVLGKGDDCDIVLADPTMPEAAMTLKAAPDGVTLDGEPMEPFAVCEFGSTAFAAGPADAPWGELKWPKKEDDGVLSPSDGESAEKACVPASSAPSASPDETPSATPRKERKRHGCLGCLFWMFLLLVALVALCWFFRDREEVRPWLDKAKPYAKKIFKADKGCQDVSGPSNADVPPAVETDVREDVRSPLSDSLFSLVERYGLAATNRAGRTVLVRDFETRVERLAATAEAYAACPEIELDFADGESLATAAVDTLALIEENDLRVAGATNRVVVLEGKAANLRRTLDALAADLPKLRDVDVSGVSLSASSADIAAVVRTAPAEKKEDVPGAPRVSHPAPKKDAPSLPICGILTTPYPCLVLRNGSRVMEGAPLGEWTIARIEADSVTLTNGERSVTWNP